MHRVGFELTIPAFERAKTVHALDRAATVVGFFANNKLKFTSRNVTSTLTSDPSI
jgi:hypothetical protein